MFGKKSYELIKASVIRLITGSLVLVVLQTLPVLAEDQENEAIIPVNNSRHLREAAKYRFEIDNDQFFNGWALQLHSAVADSWDTLAPKVELMESIGAWFPTLTGPGLKYRISLSVGQIFQTPDNLASSELITEDVPYAGLLSLKTTWIAYNDMDFRGIEFVFGVLGRPSMAEQTQNLVHKLLDVNIAQGWDNQLKDEPVFNANYMRKHKFFYSGKSPGFSFDATLDGDVQLGTLLTSAGVRIETRFGTNLPQGFAYRAEPLGRFLTYDATLAPSNPLIPSIYGTLTLGGTYFELNLFLGGNVFRDSTHCIEKEDIVGIATIGFHYERPSWGIHIDLNFTTDGINTDEVECYSDQHNKLGTTMYERRIKIP